MHARVRQPETCGLARSVVHSSTNRIPGIERPGVPLLSFHWQVFSLAGGLTILWTPSGETSHKLCSSDDGAVVYEGGQWIFRGSVWVWRAVCSPQPVVVVPATLPVGTTVLHGETSNRCGGVVAVGWGLAVLTRAGSLVAEGRLPTCAVELS